jgi:sulfur-oxidizing protein SoxB
MVFGAVVLHSAPISAKELTLLMSGDWHATLEPHAAVFRGPEFGDTPVYATEAGGLAKVARVITDNYVVGRTLYLNTGDLTHGSAEGLFTVGDAVMKVVNAVDKAIEDIGGAGIDAFTPGNWDYGYGPAVFRNRFTPGGPGIPANIAVMAGYEGADADNSERNDIIQANFPVVALNLKNAANGSHTLPSYEIIERNGLRIGVIGITAAIVPQQADTFNISFRFEQVQELRDALEDVKGEGVDLIVVQSELGLAQNIAIARSFKDIDVMYSAHTHEVTHGALIADAEKVTRTEPGAPLSGEDVSRLARGAAVVIETDRDMYVGRLDVQVAGGKIVDFDWQAIPVDDKVVPHPDVAAVVKAVTDPFKADENGHVMRHTFMPGGFCTPPSPADCGNTEIRGLQLVEDLDTVVGLAEVLLDRHHVLEEVLNNFIADAILEVTDGAGVIAGAQPNWSGVDISMTNGFRFGTVVLSEKEVAPDTKFYDGRDVGDITLRDLYTWFPVGPAVNVADFAGQAVVKSLEEILDAVFSRNPYLQRGGWYLGLSNMTQRLDLINRPFSSSSGRIIETKVGGQVLDPSKRYVFASCYAHGDPIDTVCRTNGGANHMFFTISNVDNPVADDASIGLVQPKALMEPVIVGAKVNQVAPDNFLHPVHILQRYLDTHTVNTTDHGVGRIVEVNGLNPDGTPAYTSKIDPTFVQPPEGAGPAFFSGRIGN